MNDHEKYTLIIVLLHLNYLINIYLCILSFLHIPKPFIWPFIFTTFNSNILVIFVLTFCIDCVLWLSKMPGCQDSTMNVQSTYKVHKIPKLLKCKNPQFLGLEMHSDWPEYSTLWHVLHFTAPLSKYKSCVLSVSE